MRVAIAHRHLCLLLLGLITVLCACGSGTTRKNTLIKSTKNVESSVVEISARNRSLLDLYSAEIESTADEIIVKSPSPVTRRQALTWKVEAIPALQTSLLNTDPVAAAIDAWAFILQMKAYIETPAIKQGWGEFLPVVRNTINRMEAEMEQRVRTAAPSANMTATRQIVSSWAEGHPIQAGLIGRQSADADLLRRAEQSELGTVASLKAIAENIGDLTTRLDSYNAYLPKQARWQAELLLSDLARDPQVSVAMSHVAGLSTALEKTLGNTEHLPEFLEQLHQAAQADVEAQRLALQAFVREERLETLGAFERQRIATLAAFTSERLGATADLRAERQIVLQALHDEEAAVMHDLQSTSDKAFQEFSARGHTLIDHFFLRALELALLMFVLCSLVGWILLRELVARRRDGGRRVYDRAA